MKVTELTAKNFGVYGSLKMAFGSPIAVLVGKNGSGKSWILDAIRTGVQGTSRGIPQGSRKMLALSGKRSWKLGVAIQGKESLEILRTPTTLRHGFDSPAKLSQAELDKKIGAKGDIIDAVFQASRCLEMEAHERREMLFPLLGVEVTKDQLWERGLKDPECIKHCLAHDWKRARDSARTRSRAARIAANGLLKVAVKPEPAEITWKRESLTTDQVKKEVFVEMNDSRKALQDGLAAAEAELRALDRRAKKQSRDPSGLAAVKTKELNAMKPRTLQERISVLKGESGEADGAYEEARAAYAKAQAEHDIMAKSLDELRGNLAKAERGQGLGDHPCPECGAVHSPPKKSKVLAEAVMKKDVELGEQTATIAKLYNAQAKVYAASLGARAELQGAERDLVTAQALAKEIRDLLEEAKEEEPAEVVDRDALVKSIEQFRTRLAKADETVGAVRTYWRLIAEYEGVKGKAEEEKARGTALDAQAELCGDDGIPKELLEPIIGKIRARFGKWERTLKSIKVPIEVTPTLEVLGGGIPIFKKGARWTGLPSESEMWRISVALTDAVTHLSGLRFMVLDEAAVLDPDQRKALLSTLMSVKDDYDQVIVAITLNEVLPSVPPASTGVECYLVADGTAKKLKVRSR